MLLTATTDATAISATNQDQIATTTDAVLTLTKSADRGNGVAAGDNVRYTMVAHNIGASPALPGSTLTDGSNVRVDGVSTAMVLFRDVLPAGTEYVEASLGTTTLGGIKLYRWSGDPAYSYRTNGDDRSRVIEVAVGFAQPIAPNVSIQWGFAVKVKPNPPISILNNAEVEYSNGTLASKEVSNPVPSGSLPALALWRLRAGAWTPLLLICMASVCWSSTITRTQH
ncbi:hypothetical protein [Rhodoferax sp. GW822-FHT02A01]|uniref:hypothetical protein n=1 Tax=Rhodoferax sp. GW822-FHT02A01 TaxID=3141537 RepID=UPI00315C7E4E